MYTLKIGSICLLSILLACCSAPETEQTLDKTGVSLVVLGTVQDGGSPHIGCNKECCKSLFANPPHDRKVVSLGLVNHTNKKSWLFEATPDISKQAKALKKYGNLDSELPNGIFLTHAHIGHYSGLMYLGKEATNADSTKVYALHRMKKYLATNGPWSQLVNDGNIKLQAIESERDYSIDDSIRVKSLTVPHRDEYSETGAFLIKGPNKLALFIPDIDKWSKWEMDIKSLIQNVDYAFLDATFFDGNEISHRNMDEIPHPFVVESLTLFNDLSDEDKAKINFIHFNHTNPLLNIGSKQHYKVEAAGYNIAKIGDSFAM